VKRRTIKINHLTIVLLFSLLNFIACVTLIDRWIETQALSQSLLLKRTRSKKSIDTHCICKNEPLLIEPICGARRNANFSVSTIAVTVDMIDDVKKYRPLPTLRVCFPYKVGKERKLFMKPKANIIVVSAVAIFTMVACLLILAFERM